MGRYDLPDPKCKHAPKVRVEAGGADTAHASTWVCDRDECIDDAIQWAEASTRLEARIIRPASHPVLVREEDER